MAIDLLLQEAQGLSEDTILEIVRFVQFIKQERNSQGEAAPGSRRSLSEKYAGKVKMSEDFDEPLEEFRAYM